MSKTNSDNNNSNEEKQLQFHEALAFLVETSNINNGMVSLDEIHKTFDGIIEDESMYQYIYDYLLENKITIQDYIQHNPKNTLSVSESEQSANISPSGNIPFENEEERKFVSMYLDEVNSHTKLNEAEELELLKLLYDTASEDDIKNAGNKLIEGNLHLVLSAIEDFKNKGVTIGDLIQEGNLGLIEGVSTYFSNHPNAPVHLLEFHDYLLQCIAYAMTDAINEQNVSSRIGKHLADNANRLDKASVELSQELGRTPTIQELAKYLSISEEEAQRIMKMSLDALTIDNTDASEQ